MPRVGDSITDLLSAQAWLKCLPVCLPTYYAVACMANGDWRCYWVLLADESGSTSISRTYLIGQYKYEELLAAARIHVLQFLAWRLSALEWLIQLRLRIRKKNMVWQI